MLSVLFVCLSVCFVWQKKLPVDIMCENFSSNQILGRCTETVLPDKYVVGPSILCVFFFFLRRFNIVLCFRLLYAIVLSSDVFDARARTRACV